MKHLAVANGISKCEDAFIPHEAVTNGISKCEDAFIPHGAVTNGISKCEDAFIPHIPHGTCVHNLASIFASAKAIHRTCLG